MKDLSKEEIERILESVCWRKKIEIIFVYLKKRED